MSAALSLRQRIIAAMAVVLVGLLILPPSPVVAPDSASAEVIVNGGGSTWSSIVIDQWRSDVSRQGLTINYQQSGSTQGRNQYIIGQLDFAVSEIPFQGAQKDRQGGDIVSEVDKAELREHPYEYMPIVAGGTSFLYQLNVNGSLVKDIKLSGETIAKIFTGRITNWNDPAITKDYGKQLPSIAIRPVVRSDGSGTSAQLSLWMSKQYPSIWNPFCAANGLPNPCGLTSLYPIFSGATGQPGSDGVTSFTTSSFNNGAITYVEYGYALKAGFPVVSLLNKAGYYVQPTAAAVAIALQGARLNPDRTQVLDGVYNHPDPRAYPLSSYSYMIAPVSTNAPFSAEKGKVLGQFINYLLCEGQQKAQPLGYAPLPPNLVQSAFEVVREIPGAPAPPALSNCNNPTITGGFSPDKAPLPPASDKVGAIAPGVNGPAAGGGTNTGGSGTGDPTQTGGDVLASPVDASGKAIERQPGQVNIVAATATPLKPLPAQGPGLASLLIVLLVVGGLLVPPVLIGRAGRTGARDEEVSSSRS